MRTLLADPLLTVTLDGARSLVRYQRSREPFTSLEQLREVHDRMMKALSDLSPKQLKLLVDVRDAPPRNDPAFEREVTRILGFTIEKFAAHSILVKSAVGLLQVKRLERERGAVADAPVFSTEADALRHLGL